jgi:hypothetical protein
VGALGVEGTLANKNETESLYTSSTEFSAPIMILYVLPTDIELMSIS